MPHGRHIYNKAYDMEKEVIFAYPQSYHELSHCKCVMQCSTKCSRVNIPDQETDNQYYDTPPLIRFLIYNIIACYSTYVRLPLNDKKSCRIFNKYSASENPQKYTPEKS